MSAQPATSLYSRTRLIISRLPNAYWLVEINRSPPVHYSSFRRRLPPTPHAVRFQFRFRSNSNDIALEEGSMTASAAAALLNLLGYITGLSLYTMLLVMLLTGPRLASPIGTEAGPEMGMDRIRPTVCHCSQRYWDWPGIWARYWILEYTISAVGAHRRCLGRRPSLRSDSCRRWLCIRCCDRATRGGVR